MRFGVKLKETCPMCGQFLPDEETTFKTGVLEVRPIKGQVLVRDQEVHLTPTERRILVLLAANLDELVTYSDLYEAGCNMTLSEEANVRREQRHVLRVHLTRLRGRLGPEAGGYMTTVRGPRDEGGVRLRRV